MAIALALAAAIAPFSASAQTVNDVIATKTKGASQGQDKLLVEANEIVYDNDKNTVSAVGDVHLYYQGRTLQADKVVYDRNTKRVLASGNARLTETDGTVATGETFELTDDFKNGFINSLRVETTDKTHFTSPRAERTGGETTVFDEGTYTACEACRKHPDRPPLWQVRAAKIIHNNTERMIYYENAAIEFAGVPLAWVPYFSTPDPTVKRKTGFLAPHYIANTALGMGASVPFFWNLAPNYDLTLTPTVLSRQGFLGQVEWRHRLLNGSYSIRAAGIFQQDKSAFLTAPAGAGNKDFRGSIESNGRFYLNPRWQWGWDVAAVSDKWFLDNYHIRSESLSSTYFRESTSTLFLTGKSDTGYFDMRGYYFKGLSYYDWQKQQPIVHPVIDYNKRLNGPKSIGGEISLDFNFTSLTRDAAYYQQIPFRTTNLFPSYNGYSLYDTCTTFQRSACIVKGIGGTYSRATAQATWRRTFIDPLGQTWTPFASMRIDGEWVSPNTDKYQNNYLPNFIGGNGSDEYLWRAMPAVGVEYRYPLVNVTSRYGTHMLEPIAQIVARPSETRTGRAVNEDAQSLVFDDTTIFEWNKFSGYDRVEGGVRANYGLKYSITTKKGGYADLLFGQSYQIAGRNSFAAGDISNTGLDSGLQRKQSDYVGRFHLAPTSLLSFTTRTRFDERTFAMKRVELQTNLHLGPVTTSVVYARYAAQPDLGVPERREGLATSATWQVTPHWSVNGAVLFDLGRNDQDKNAYFLNPAGGYLNSPLWSVASASGGLEYKDECTTFGITYSSTFNDPSTGTRGRNQTVLLRLELRTLGAATLRQAVSSSAQDGINQ